jgi:rhodanese-related sulfurtransferase
MNKLFLFLIMMVNLAACQEPQSKGTDESGKQNQTSAVLEPKEFLAKFKATKDAQLLDVRTPEEVAEGALEAAQNINFYDSDFKDKLSKLDKNKPVFVYCRSGGRSGKCAQMCKDMGFKEIYDMKGGWQNYSSQK